MSTFTDISIAVRAENRASSAFRSIALDVATLGGAFGLLSNEQVKYVSIAFTAVRVIQSMGVVVKALTGAHSLHTIAASAAAFAQNTLNISYGTFLALTGVGIVTIMAAAAAMLYFANSMNQANQSVKSFNDTAVTTANRTRSIQRAGEQDLLRRGVE